MTAVKTEAWASPEKQWIYKTKADYKKKSVFGGRFQMQTEQIWDSQNACYVYKYNKEKQTNWQKKKSVFGGSLQAEKKIGIHKNMAYFMHHMLCVQLVLQEK